MARKPWRPSFMDGVVEDNDALPTVALRGLAVRIPLAVEASDMKCRELSQGAR
jgi:hypothetical protein